jgi:hypothetical protein
MNTRPPRSALTAAVVAAAAACLAAAALGLPARAEPPSKDGGGQRRDFPGGPRGGFDRSFDPNSEEGQRYQEALKAFCVKHSPRRWQEIEDRIQKFGHRASFMRIHQMSLKFRELQKLEKEDPALHALKVSMIEVEDVEYGLITDLRQLPKGDDKQAAQLRNQLREQNQRYVELRLKERDHRLERLAKIVEDEKRQLDQDRQESGRLIDERMADIEKRGPDFFLPRYGRRGESPESNPATAPAPAPAPADK